MPNSPSPMIEVFKMLVSFITGSLIAILGEPTRKKLERTPLTIEFDPKKDILITPEDKHKFAKYVKIKLQNKGTSKYAKLAIPAMLTIDPVMLTTPR